LYFALDTVEPAQRGKVMVGTEIVRSRYEPFQE
jgi:hypothetical protein